MTTLPGFRAHACRISFHEDPVHDSTSLSVASRVTTHLSHIITRVQSPTRFTDTTMGFELREVDPATDFPAIARSMFESYEDPPQPFFHAFFPIHGDTHDAREEAIAECATRLHSWHTEDPTSY